MTEKAAKSLAIVLNGEAVFPMPGSRSWGVTLERPDGLFAAIEDHGGWLYRDRSAYDAYHREGDQDGIEHACEWGEWDDSEEWAKGLSLVLGSEEYWNSGGGIWLVFHQRPDGRFAVIGSESGNVYGSREEYESDEYGEKAENHVFV
jgi:hypothetical protein